MICEKCGSNNPKNSAACPRCGANMPDTEMCGGFGDILSYEGPTTVVNTSVSNGVNEKIVQNLEKKLNVAIQTQRKFKILSIISWSFSLIILVCLIFTICASCSKNKATENSGEFGGKSSVDSAVDTMKRSDFEENKGSAGYIFSEVIENIESIFN